MIRKLLLLLLLLTSLAVQAKPGLLEGLGLSSDDDAPPDVDKVFVFSAGMVDPVTIVAQWQITDGNYLYRDKINFEIIGNKNVHLLPFSMPESETKDDDIFGKTQVYHHDTEVILPLDRTNQSQTITLRVHYQGCSETYKICYPPTEKSVQLKLPAITGNNPQQVEQAGNVANSAPLSEQDQIAQKLANDNLLQIMLSFFGLGVLLAFTPCVFPMIPILSSIIVGEGETITTRRAFTLSLLYVLAMSVTYTAAGVLTGLLGENLQATLQNPWVIGSFSALFIVLALSMFGLYELQLPQALQHHLHQLSHRQQGGTFIGVILMGLLSGLLVGPCLAPPLAGALIFIGQHADPVFGGIALFTLSMGMGLPLLIIGTSAGTLLPKAGSWMNNIKAVFGVLMLGLAIWLLDRIIPGWITLLLWGILLIVTAVYMGALDSLDIDASGWSKLWKGAGLVLLIYGGLLIIGGASGSNNLLQPLRVIAAEQSGQTSHTAELQFTRIHSLAELQQQLTQTTKPVMLDFYADWCTDCKIMAATTFRDSKVISALSGYKLLQLDMTQNSDKIQAITNHFNVFGPPTMLFFDRDGKEHHQYRLIGKVSAEQLLKHLQQLPATAVSL